MLWQQLLPPVLDKQPSHVVPDGPEDSPPRVSGNPEEYTFEDMEREYGLAEPSSAGYSPTLGSDSDHDDGDDEEYIPKRRSARSRPVKRPNAVAGRSEVDKSRKVVSEKFFTHGCKACQSGMNAPGIRHSALCKRPREELNASCPASGQREDEGSVVEGPKVFQPVPEQPADLGEAQKSEFQGRKRQSDTSLEKLEKDLKGEGEDMEVDHDLFSLGSVVPVEGDFECRTPATSPLMFDECVAPIKFHGNDAKSERIKLCNKEVLLWHPSEAVDDTTLIPLDPQLTVEGMREEVRNMTKCDVGRVVTAHDVELAKKSGGVRVIPARWVTAFKTNERVRARVVAKDLKSKSSARALGFSSPTPSCEVLHIILSIAAENDWRMRALDVFHAFMHSPLPGRSSSGEKQNHLKNASEH